MSLAEEKVRIRAWEELEFKARRVSAISTPSGHKKKEKRKKRIEKGREIFAANS